MNVNDPRFLRGLAIARGDGIRQLRRQVWSVRSASHLAQRTARAHLQARVVRADPLQEDRDQAGIEVRTTPRSRPSASTSRGFSARCVAACSRRPTCMSSASRPSFGRRETAATDVHDQHDLGGIYRLGHTAGDEHGSRNEGSDLLLVRAVPPCLGTEGSERATAEGVPEPGVQEPLLGSTPSGRGTEAAARGCQEAPQEVARKRGPVRYQCRHCGGWYRTPNSGALWNHSDATTRKDPWADPAPENLPRLAPTCPARFAVGAVRSHEDAPRSQC